MKVRQARKIMNNVVNQRFNYRKGQVQTALRTIWRRSRHAEGPSEGKRMGGGIKPSTVRTVAGVLLGQVKVDEYGRKIINQEIAS